MASGTGWGDMGDKGDKPGYNTWNVDVFVTVIQDLVNILNSFEQLLIAVTKFNIRFCYKC